MEKTIIISLVIISYILLVYIIGNLMYKLNEVYKEIDNLDKIINVNKIELQKKINKLKK